MIKFAFLKHDVDNIIDIVNIDVAIRNELFLEYWIPFEQQFFKYCKRKTGDIEDAQDLCQYSCEKMVEKLDTGKIDCKEAFRKMMYKIAKDRYADDVRHSERTKEILGDSVSINPEFEENFLDKNGNNSPEKEYEKKELHERIDELKDNRARMVIELHDIEGLKIEEVSVQREVGYENCKKLRKKGIDELKQKYGEVK